MIDREGKKAVVVDEMFPVKFNGFETSFGTRYASEIVCLTPEQLKALQDGKMLAVDVQNEYIVYIKQGEK